MCVHSFYSTCVAVREQLSGIGFLLLPLDVFKGLNTSYQACIAGILSSSQPFIQLLILVCIYGYLGFCWFITEYYHYFVA